MRISMAIQSYYNSFQFLNSIKNNVFSLLQKILILFITLGSNIFANDLNSLFVGNKIHFQDTSLISNDSIAQSDSSNDLKPKRTSAILLSVLPGLGQYYKQHKTRSLLFGVSFVTGAVLTTVKHFEYKSNNKKYNDLNEQYKNASSEINALYLGNETQKYYKLSKQSSRARDSFLYITSGIYLLSILDVLISEPASGYKIDNQKKLMNNINVNLFEQKISIALFF